MTSRQDQLRGPKRELLNQLRAAYRRCKLDVHWADIFVTNTASGLMPTVRGVPVPMNFLHIMYRPCPNKIKDRRIYLQQWINAYNEEMAPLMIKDPGTYVRWRPEETFPTKAFVDELYTGTRDMRHRVSKAISDYVALKGDASPDVTEPATQPTASCSLPAAQQDSAPSHSATTQDDSLQDFEQAETDNNNNVFKGTDSDGSYDPEQNLAPDFTEGDTSVDDSDIQIIDD